MIREKLYRDPVHDLIALDKESREDATLMALIDTPEMQRLRRIRQLGLAFMAFQGAEHSRFAHALGVLHIATRILTQLGKHQRISSRVAFATRCAAVLHDIGHGPYSHVFETFLGIHHESWTQRIICSPRTGVNRVLRTYHPALPREVAAILAGQCRPLFLSQIIASQLDADRLDYLLRDSIQTGVKYGIYDLDRLIYLLRVDPAGENIVVASGGVLPVEKYLQARYHMYEQVYFHKTVRAAEMMFRLLLKRFADLTRRRVATAGAPDDPLVRLIRDPAGVSLTDYLDTDDSTIQHALTRWRRGDDPVLADLSGRLLDRQLFKTLDVSRVKGVTTRLRQAREIIAGAGLDPQYYIALDTSSSVPYRPYDPKQPEIRNHILVETPGQRKPYRDIHDLSPVVQGLARATAGRRRVVFPESHGGLDLRAAIERVFLA
ncbi:MAG: HD domain-containing protein [Candidatus Sumerlaeaceae bacterium]|nr:HD domain-containing protein [Candidatus Sumerlaeaceae bacterium]